MSVANRYSGGPDLVGAGGSALAPESGTRREADEADEAPGRPARVLLVDDEDAVSALFHNLLTPPEFLLTALPNAELALETYVAGAFDLAILDKNLPGKSGLELMRELKAHDPLLEVIVITGYASLQTAIEALQLGAYDFVEKPFVDIDIIVQKVRKAVERRALTVMNQQLVASLQSANQRLTERNIELLEAQDELMHQLRLSSVGQLTALAGVELSDPLAGIKSNTYVLEEQLRPTLFVLRQLSAAATAARDGDPELGLRILRESADSGALMTACEGVGEAAQMLAEMKESIERLVSMIKAMQLFTQQARREQRPFDVRVCIERALDLAERQRRRQGVELRLDLPAELPPVRGAPLLFTQAFLNIVQNALESIPAEGLVEVRVRVEDGVLRIVVSDTGSGIARADLPRVLKPFFTTKESHRHMGLGLNLAHEIVRRHGGTLKVESDPGTGTRVVLKFPLGAG